MPIFKILLETKTCTTIAEIRKLIHAGVVRQGTKVFTSVWEETRPIEIEPIYVGKRKCIK